MTVKKLPIIAAGDISQKSIVLPPMRVDKKAAISVSVLIESLFCAFRWDINSNQLFTQVPDNRRALLVNESHPSIRGTIARIKLTSKESDLWENVFGK